jgi:hypothetical protein
VKLHYIQPNQTGAFTHRWTDCTRSCSSWFGRAARLPNVLDDGHAVDDFEFSSTNAAMTDAPSQQTTRAVTLLREAEPTLAQARRYGCGVIARIVKIPCSGP